jgi:hypothetical protein
MKKLILSLLTALAFSFGATASPGKFLPTVNAGVDSVLTISGGSTTDTAYLNGKVSGTVGSVTYLWTKISGPGTQTITRPNDKNTRVTGLAVGTYTFRLTVTDANGASSDDVQLTVRSCTVVNQTITVGGDGGVFMVANLSVLPGTVYHLDSSVSASINYIYLQDFKGAPGCPIKLENRGTVKMKNGLAVHHCEHFEISGTGPVGDSVRHDPDGKAYGISIIGKFKEVENGNFNTYEQQGVTGLEVDGSSRFITVHNVEVWKAKYGFRFKDDDVCDSMFNRPYGMQFGHRIYDNWLHYFESQGMYNGNTEPNNGTTQSRQKGCPFPPLGNVFYNPGQGGYMYIARNRIDSVGRPGLQISTQSAGLSRITKNKVSFTGLQGDDAQGGGIVLGGYTNAIVDSNIIRHAYSWGLQHFGTKAYFLDNVSDSGGYSALSMLWIKNGSNVVIGVNPDVASTLAFGNSGIFGRANKTYPLDSAHTYAKFNTFTHSRINESGSSTDDYLATLFSSPGLSDLDTWSRLNKFWNNTYAGTIYNPPHAMLQNNGDIQMQAENWPTPSWISAGIDIYTKETDAVLQGYAEGLAGTTITSTVWSQRTGPNTATITSPNTLWTEVVGLIDGNYVMYLTVTNSAGTVTVDSMNIVVNNKFPVITATANHTIKLPTNSTNFTASVSDPDGTIMSHTWHLVNNTNASWWLVPAIGDRYANNTSITNFQEPGVYTFRYTAFDNALNYSTKDVVVTVLASDAIAPPSPNAGSDRSISTSTVALNGSAITDAGQSITSWAWTKISGPGTTSIPNPNNQNVTASGLVVGTYVFRLTVSQTDGQTAFDEVTITVTSSAPPTVNAGADVPIAWSLSPITFSLPSGTASGSGGHLITGYLWSKISGPGTATFSPAATSQVVSVTIPSTPGTYVFRLTATQDDAQTNFDELIVTVAERPGTVIPRRGGKKVYIQF